VDPVDQEAVRGELAALGVTFSKADVSRRLLAYLVECHLSGKVPRETDIALDVFHRDGSFDGSQDAVVRVAVRALRQKLDEFYNRAGAQRPFRLEIPRGAYRLTVVPQIAPVAAEPPLVEPPPRPSWLTGRGPWVTVALIACLLAGVVLWKRPADPAPPAVVPARASVLWQPLLTSSRPLTIVLGDLLLFPNPSAEPGRIQLIRDARINTAEQLRSFLGARPDAGSADPGTQVATTLIPKSVAYGLVDVLPVVSDGRREVSVHILDELQVEDLRTHDVLFMGPLVRIGPLADALFRNSRYEFNYDHEPRRLRDRITGKEFAPSTGRRENASDYGLFASLRGPSGNRIMIFASVGSDLGLLPLMRYATSAQGLEELRRRLADSGPLPDEFEAVMAVSGYYRTDLSAEMVDAHKRSGELQPE
jgi:hypothetical protein